MTAQNPDNQWDRIATLYDVKQRIIDLTDFHMPPPEVGIYDEPVRYFKANKEWCAFIFGFLSWMQHEAFWEEAEDTNYHAIQQILIFEEGIEGGILMSPDEYRKATRDALYEAWNRLAAQVVSGRFTDISVDGDGNVSNPSDALGGAEPVEDDPTTEAIDESLASVMGGAISVTRALEKFFDKIDFLYGVVNGAPVVAEVDAANILHSYYPSDEILMQTGVGNYYAYRATNGVIGFNSDATIERYMFCRGYSALAFNQWLIDHSLYAEPKRVMVSSLVEALSSELWSHYYAVGAAVPSIDYKAAGCTKVKTETFQLDMSTANAPQFTTSEIWKNGHRFLVEVSGTYSDTALPDLIGDGMWFHDTVLGTKTFSPLNFNSAAAVVPPVQAQVPFEPSHVYQFTVEKTQGAADGSCIITRDNGAMNVSTTTGILTVTITDVGDFSI